MSNSKREYAIIPREGATYYPIVKIKQRTKGNELVETLQGVGKSELLNEFTSETLNLFEKRMKSEGISAEGTGGIIACAITDAGFEMLFDRFDMRAIWPRPTSGVVRFVVCYDGNYAEVTMTKDETNIEGFRSIGENAWQKELLVSMGSSTRVVSQF